MTTIEMRIKLREHYKTWNIKDSPYDYGDWYRELSGAEYKFFDDIRTRGINMFPEYPVGKYFIDFSFPSIKLGVEIDGKEWHIDKEKDRIRQENIESLGWKVIRIEGWETMAYDYEPSIDDFYDIEEYEEAYTKFYNKYKRYIDIINFLKQTNNNLRK